MHSKMMFDSSDIFFFVCSELLYTDGFAHCEVILSCPLPKIEWQRMVFVNSRSFDRSLLLTRTLTKLLTHHTHSLTHSRPLTHSVTHSLTFTLSVSLSRMKESHESRKIMPVILLGKMVGTHIQVQQSTGFKQR